MSARSACTTYTAKLPLGCGVSNKMKGWFRKSKPGETTGRSPSPFRPHFRWPASKFLILPLGWRFLEVGAEIENTAAGFGLLTNHELFDFDFRFSMAAKADAKTHPHPSGSGRAYVMRVPLFGRFSLQCSVLSENERRRRS